MITDQKAMYDYVIMEYQKYDTELNGLYFDFDVRMKEREILDTYALIQYTINGDEVVRIEKDVQEEPLIPEGEFEGIYEGNCMEYLERYNNSNFARYCDDEKLDFIF